MQYNFFPVQGRTAWKGSKIDYMRDGLVQISADELTEIEVALAALKCSGEVDLPVINRDSFPLPLLGVRLKEIAQELRFGLGFVLIRGLQRSNYEADDLARIYCGIGMHLGHVIPQSGDGELLGHVMNVSDLVDESVRGYRSDQSMNMHSDGHDVVGLLCLTAAKAGGTSCISSAAAIHDRIVSERPDLAAELYAGMKISRMSKDADRGNGFQITPGPVSLFTRHEGEFMACIHAAMIRDAANKGAFEMSVKQEEALDLLCELAESPEFVLDMNICEGDIQFLNNRLILHGRTSYEDHKELFRRRHLMRLWVNIPGWPQRPANQQDVFALEDLPLWAAHRTPFMEFPSRYLKQFDER
jgi:hypothetical protein